MKHILPIFILTIFLANCKKEDLKTTPALYNTDHTENWMQDLIAEFPNSNFSFKDISIPRAHDAGMYEANNCFGGNECNTVTQERDMLSMLESGVRMFDVRPILKEDVYWTYHATGCNQFGCEGDLLIDLLEQTNTFLENHNELVILELSHFCNTSASDAGLLDILNNVFGDKIYKENTPLDTAFIYTPLKELIPPSNSSGKVVLKMDGLSPATENRAEGYFGHHLMPTSGNFSDMPVLDNMKADQLNKFNDFPEDSPNLYRLSWTLTQDNALAIFCIQDAENDPTSILDLAYDARDDLSNTIDSWIASGTIHKGKIPNIISVDVANTVVAEECNRLSKLNIE